MTYLLIAPLHPPHPKPQLPLLRTHHRRLHRRHHPALVMHQHRTRVLIPPRIALPLTPHKARDPLRKPKRHNHLVDQMCAQIIHCAGARRGFGLPAPRCGEGGAVPVEVRFEFGNAAEGGGLEEGEEGQEVGVPAAVLEGCQLPRHCGGRNGEGTDSGRLSGGAGVSSQWRLIRLLLEMWA